MKIEKLLIALGVLLFLALMLVGIFCFMFYPDIASEEPTPLWFSIPIGISCTLLVIGYSIVVKKNWAFIKKEIRNFLYN